MSLLRRAAELLSSSSSLRGAERIAAHLAFGDPLPLDATSLRSLELSNIRRATVARGPGVLRCCMATAAGDADPREVAARCLHRLAERTPHILWLVVVVKPVESLVVVAVSPVPGGNRAAALVVDTRRVQDSDAETLAAMADAVGANDVLTHHRWRELLGRDSLSRRFYRDLEAAVGELSASAESRAPERDRREIALLATSRLLFLAFLEAKGWLDSDREFLRHRFDECCATGGAVHRRLLDPLFFGTLNTPASRRALRARGFGRVPFLNGGLFARAPVERRWRETRLSDDAIGGVICRLLGRFRVTAREESTSWSEAAVDPEMLGRAFESLMATDDRRKSGAFYTPLAILERVTSEGLDLWLRSVRLSGVARTALREDTPVPKGDRAALFEAIDKVRILDPACGSGSFLVHALERVADLRKAAGDARPASDRRRDVLTRSIFGVDVNPTAVWLCEMRLWLSMVIDADERDAMRVAPLPNLDHHIRVGDALAGPGFADDWEPRPAGSLLRLRARYCRATGARKRTLGRSLAATERGFALADARADSARCTARRRDLVLALRGRDLFHERIVPSTADRAELATLRRAARNARRRIDAIRAGAALPFSFRTQFADAGAAGGFDLIVGNPPWVRLHRIAPGLRDDFALRFRSWREATWTEGARDASTGRGFASQVDLAGLFVERAAQVARPGGAISLLVPAKLWTSLSAGGVRQVIRAECRVSALEDWSESPAAFDAVVYPSLLVATRERRPWKGESASPMRGAVHRRESTLRWELRDADLALDESPGAPWLLLPPEVRAAFELLARRGTRLAHTPLGRPLLGVKTGCNEAFLVTPRPGWREATADDAALWCVRAGGREDVVEPALLRAVLRGEDLRAWQCSHSDDAILWTHGTDGDVLDRLPPLAGAWLTPWRTRLESRSDAVRARRWWSLFRTESAESRRTRVVWSDISRVPRAIVLEAGDSTVALNSCYVLPTRSSDEAHAFAALLNSAPVAAWLCALAEPARGGYRRFLGWTIARLPVPARWERAVAELAPIGRAAAKGEVPDARALAGVVARAYGIRLPHLEPLITWCLR
jgi:hypothetical protein